MNMTPQIKIEVDTSCVGNVIEKNIKSIQIQTPMQVTKYLTDKSKIEAVKNFNKIKST
jgi:hypothetical protein